MKTVSRVFGIIFLLIALVTCSLSIHRAQLDKDDTANTLTEVNAELTKLKDEAKTLSGEAKTYVDEQISKAEEQIAKNPSASTYLIVQIFLSVLLVLGLAFAVFLFRTNLKTSTQLVAAAIIATAVTYFISPDIARGPYSGMESRTLALLSGVPVIIVGLFAILAAKKNNIKLNH